ncbi:early endosome antigen 1-like isoform X2 [Neocloeon triangulifer]|uniref:early endosome antigen 1-like isoform X2 n=1 Tax=Neocloeon triangulifer TaxID=2078957 RepID=UPI00286FA812|nr:early endosome antigen 1-like isoform X2 [Neocloeon triangulifer]
MLHSERRYPKSRTMSAQARSSSVSRLSLLDRAELEEKFAKSLSESNELKKRNNELQDSLRQLKARLRWPAHLQEAVLSKETQQQAQSLKAMEMQNSQLIEKCHHYEHVIGKLEDRLESNKDFPEEVCSKILRVPEDSVNAERLQNNGHNLATPIRCSDKPTPSDSHYAAVKKAMDEWKSHALAYKQQAAEAVTRLKDTEERLAQMLRLHTLDSAELIRTSRASKHSMAQLTTIQDENRLLKDAVKKFQEKFEDVVGQLEAEKLRNVELQEAASQVLQLQRGNSELLIEIEDLKEKSAIQGQMNNVVREAGKVPEALELETKHLRKQLDVLRTEHAADLKKIQQELEEKCQALANFREHEEELRSKLNGLQCHKLPTKEPTQHKMTQTINFEVDLKPPEATVELTNEESDQMLSQMSVEVEVHKQAMRSMQSMCESYKKELEGLHDQLQTERKSYARQLSLEMAQFKALQEQLKNHTINNQLVVTADVEPSKKTPKPKPRKISNPVRKAEEHCAEPDTKELVLEIESLEVPEKSLIAGISEFKKFFIEFKLVTSKGEQSEIRETPENYPLPTSHLSPAIVGHKHIWQVQEHQSLFGNTDCLIQFDLVADNDNEPDDACTEIGIGKLPLSELLNVAKPNIPVCLDVPVRIEEDDETVAHLKVALTKLI